MCLISFKAVASGHCLVARRLSHRFQVPLFHQLHAAALVEATFGDREDDEVAMAGAQIQEDTTRGQARHGAHAVGSDLSIGP